MEAERSDRRKPGVKVCVAFQEWLDGLRRHVIATREGNVWMPGAQFRFESCGERGFVNALVNQEKLWVAGADTCPNDSRFATAGKVPMPAMERKNGLKRTRASFSRRAASPASAIWPRKLRVRWISSRLASELPAGADPVLRATDKHSRQIERDEESFCHS